VIESSSGRFYFWGERALYLGPDIPATVHAHHAVQVCIGLSGPARLGTGAGAPCVNYRGAVIPSDQPHETDVPIALIASFWLEPDTAEAQRLVQPGEDASIRPIERPKLGDVVPRLLDCWNGRYESRRAAALLDEVVQILAPHRRPLPVIDPRVARAREILDSAADRRVPLAQVARSVGLSSSRLAHLLGAELGLPARRYLLWLRLRDAIGELARGASITEAGHAAGFADGAHFSRTFRRMLGFTPSDAMQVSKFVQDAPVKRR
jgi:AraC-like DNA-binding protein